MQVQIETAALTDRMKRLLVITDANPASPAYANVLLVAAEGVATLTAFSPQIGTLETIITGVTGDNGALLLPAPKIAEILPSLQAKVVTLSSDFAPDSEGQVNIALKCGKYRAALRVRPAKDFVKTMALPTVDETLTTPFALAALIKLAERVNPAVPKESSKFSVPVARLEFTETNIRLIGTGGYFLGCASAEVVVRTPDNAVPPSMNIPKTALEKLSLLDGTGTLVTLFETENALFFKTETDLLGIMTIPGAKFPAYESVLPKATPTTVITVAREALSYAVDRARPVAEKENPLILFALEQLGAEISPLEVSSSSKETGLTNDFLDVKATGVPVSFAVNHNYLKPFVDHAGPDVVIEIVSPKAVFKFIGGPDFFYIIAPAQPAVAPAA